MTPTKAEQLAALPLRECTECGRLEFAYGDFEPRCLYCGESMDLIHKDSLTCFEAVAQHFHRDTGYLRPGKSASPLDYRNHEGGERESAWQKWNREPLDVSKKISSQPPAGVIQ